MSPSPSTSLRPARALAHPLWWVALALLVANDHLFKGAGVLPSALTGKLSDFAGLLVAPVVLAALLGVRGRRGWIASHLAVGAGFAAINLSPAIARVVEAATLPTPFPWWITVDPTDLVALPMLAVSAAVFGAWIARPVAPRPALARLGLAVGSVACVATSPPEEQPPEPFQPEEWPEPQPGTTFSEVTARVAIANLTDGQVVLRTRTLRDEVAIDCEAVARDPSLHLTPDLFGAPVLWDLQPGTLLGDALIDDGRRDCRVVLVSTPVQTRLMFFGMRDFTPRTLRHDLGTEPRDAAIIGLRDTDGRARLAEHPALYAEPRVEPIDVELSCGGPAPGAGLAWTAPPAAIARVLDHAIGPDGCHAIDLGAPDPIGRWYLCAPGAPIEFVVGDEIAFDPRGDDRHQELRVHSGDRILRLFRGVTLDPLPGLRAVEPGADDPCRAAWRDACDGVQAPLRIIDADGALPIGEPAISGDDRVTVLRAERAAVVDTGCDPWAVVGPRFEIVVDTHAADLDQTDMWEAPR